MSRKPIDVAAAVLWRGDKLLIAQRPNRGEQPGLWEFPGGKREPSESWENCLRRELREELGIEVKVGALRFETTYAYPAKTVHIAFFDCVLIRGEPAPRPGHCRAVEWVSLGELAGYELPEADYEFVANLVKASPVSEEATKETPKQ